MSEMIERAAKAMKSMQDASWQELPWRELARAALAAIEEPSVKMIGEGAAVIKERFPDDEDILEDVGVAGCIALEVWRTMHKAMMEAK